jgi:5'-nucleotidase
MGVARYGEHYIKRKDPKGRTYYWATNDPPPPKGEGETDLTALEQGYISLTPLQYDMTRHSVLSRMQSWKLDVPPVD